MEKPPIGLMPRYIWDEQNPSPTSKQCYDRFFEIKEAFARYSERKMSVPFEWRAEFHERLQQAQELEAYERGAPLRESAARLVNAINALAGHVGIEKAMKWLNACLFPFGRSTQINK